MAVTMARRAGRNISRIENISVGLKWRSQPCLRFFKDMKATLVEFIILIFNLLVSSF